MSVLDARACTKNCSRAALTENGGRREKAGHERRGRSCVSRGSLAHAPIENAGDGGLKTYTSVEDACACTKNCSHAARTENGGGRQKAGHEHRGRSCEYRGLLAHAPIENAGDGGLKACTSVEDARACTKDCLHTHLLKMRGTED